MRTWTAIACGLLVSILVTMELRAQEPDSAAAYERAAIKLIKAGDLDAALEQYRNAAGAEDADAELQQRFFRLSRIIKMRRALVKTDPAQNQRWWGTAAALADFYDEYGLDRERLDLAARMYGARPSATAAIMLAEARIATGADAEALAPLDAFRDELAGNLEAGTLRGLALARTDRKDEAAKVLAGLPGTDEAAPRLLVQLARLEVLCDASERALVDLRRAIETSTPAGLPRLKERIAAAPELVAGPAKAEVAVLMKLESKVVKSSCSGGSDCSSCPSRSKGCGGSTPAEGKKDEPKPEPERKN
ncbi:MAG: hypothetical protein H6807_15490 [Planctomycetes bacterium]|nr:hypothetical protein [Planctomycetota bacterium]